MYVSCFEDARFVASSAIDIVGSGAQAAADQMGVVLPDADFISSSESDSDCEVDCGVDEVAALVEHALLLERRATALGEFRRHQDQRLEHVAKSRKVRARAFVRAARKLCQQAVEEERRLRRERVLVEDVES